MITTILLASLLACFICLVVFLTAMVYEGKSNIPFVILVLSAVIGGVSFLIAKCAFIVWLIIQIIQACK